MQEEQCRETTLPFYTWGEDTLWTDRMSQTTCFPAFCGQAIRLPRNYVALGRESRGFDTGHKLSQEVRYSAWNIVEPVANLQSAI
jgi:hypothetical protein